MSSLVLLSTEGQLTVEKLLVSRTTIKDAGGFIFPVIRIPVVLSELMLRCWFEVNFILGAKSVVGPGKSPTSSLSETTQRMLSVLLELSVQFIKHGLEFAHETVQRWMTAFLTSIASCGKNTVRVADKIRMIASNCICKEPIRRVRLAIALHLTLEVEVKTRKKYQLGNSRIV